MDLKHSRRCTWLLTMGTGFESLQVHLESFKISSLKKSDMMRCTRVGSRERTVNPLVGRPTVGSSPTTSV